MFILRRFLAFIPVALIVALIVLNNGECIFYCCRLGSQS